MRTLIILLLLIVSSCTKKDEPKIQKPIKFQKINYSLANSYLDSLAKKINPNRKYQYWQYARYKSSMLRHTILNESGDTLLRKKIDREFDKIKYGIFKGGHPFFSCYYAITIENGKVNYINEEEFRGFLGTIDNLEEAMLLAETYDYSLDSDIRGSEYREVENGFELHLMRFNDNPLSKESFEIEVSQNGILKAKSRGIYCKGQKCRE
ncbi:hypothetical protein [Flavobacterium sp. 102]|uniref:hypothetical protein n=1 Tax=Flavobacterium sp. 102 TaxID=2135623 RepID=UPI000EB38700|nr:hypothetical protein [Flavobacterium sp. 102]RKS02872.1 hypothetical protein C8C84_2602 [Flavobacterium sp. 102]RKS02878.1 hypothetical protein C8C84_2608 [Flavobacterium sp. 102]